MKKEPFILYLVKLFCIFGLFIWTGMLYWSSLLVEEDLQGLKLEMSAIRSQIENQTVKTVPKYVFNHSKIDTQLPNLLQEDPFYKTTLPKLLGPNFSPHGTMHEASFVKPENLHPFSEWAQVQSWLGLCNVSPARLAFGKYESFAPYMALKMEQRGNQFWIFLRNDVYWQPILPTLFSEKIDLASHFSQKHPLTAHDFKFHYDAVMNPHNQEGYALAERTFLRDIEKVEVIDDFTFVVTWNEKNIDGVLKIKYIAKQITGYLMPLASFVYKYFPDGTKIVEEDEDPETYRKDSIWAQNFAQHWAKNIIVSCGPWNFAGMSDAGIKFERNPDFFEPLDALTARKEVFFRNSSEIVWQDFISNHLEYTLLMPTQVEQLDQFMQSEKYQEQVRAKAAIKRLEYVARAYTFIGWNQATPYFSSKKVRQAMTSLIDRQRIINQNLNGMGVAITGPFYLYSTSYDQSIQPIPYDVGHARNLLEEEGWYDTDGDGIIDKEIDGKRVPFRFSLTYYVKNDISKSICEYIATSLKGVGIDCKLNGIDTADLSAATEGKTFDALFLGWALGTPPEDPRQLWHSEGAKQPGSSNAIGFQNEECDAIIEQLEYEDDPEKRIKLYHRFHAILHEEQPYTFLYTPKRTLLYREYLQNVFIPADRQDLIPGANTGEPVESIFWINGE